MTPIICSFFGSRSKSAISFSDRLSLFRGTAQNRIKQRIPKNKVIHMSAQCDHQEVVDCSKVGLNVPRVLTIAGSDSGGGAGIQADLKACAARGVYCTTVVTAVTAQNTTGVQAVEKISVHMVEAQISSIFVDIGTDVVKTGMLPDAETISAVCKALLNFSYRALVVDPVLISTSGHALTDNSVVSAFRQELLPLADLVTPNLPEAASILGWDSSRKICTVEDMKLAAKEIHSLGPKFVLIKGGHLSSDNAVDVLFDGTNFELLTSDRIETRNNHGTGCTLASAISAELAKGKDMTAAVKAAKDYITEILNSSKDLTIGKGSQGPMNHVPSLNTWTATPSPRERFKPSDLLLYAVTDPQMNAKWGRSMAEAVKGAIAGGATILQIREKTANTGAFIKSAQEAVLVAKQAGIPIVINDRIDVALAVDADGIHIGQSDMPASLARAILGPSKIIGVSSKTVEHAKKAFEDGADYIGVGGVYPTNTKADNTTIGIDGLREVCAKSLLPVVAIGGIKRNNLADIFSSVKCPSLSGIAIVSAVFDQQNVEVATTDLKKCILEVAP